MPVSRDPFQPGLTKDSSMTPLDQLLLQSGAEHLHRCGPRAIAELLADVANRIGGGPAIIAALNDYQHITPEMLRAAGGDRFPRRPLRVVPRWPLP
jgi:hypothetical protein